MRIPRRTNLPSRVILNAKSNIHRRECLEQPKPSIWSSAIKLFAAAGALGGLVLHLTGYVSQQSYLRVWGIDSGLFPQDLDDAIILGYYALFDRTFSIFSAVKSISILKAATVSLLVAIYIYLVIRFINFTNEVKLPRQFSLIPKWINELATAISLTFATVAGIPAVLALFALILAIPIIVADSFGNTTAIENVQSYAKGCNQSAESPVCVELCSAEKSLAKGFVIESSESHIAIYDVKLKRALAFDRAGTNLIAAPPKTYSDGEATKIPSVTCKNFSPN